MRFSHKYFVVLLQEPTYSCWVIIFTHVKYSYFFLDDARNDGKNYGIYPSLILQKEIRVYFFKKWGKDFVSFPLSSKKSELLRNSNGNGRGILFDSGFPFPCRTIHSGDAEVSMSVVHTVPLCDFVLVSFFFSFPAQHPITRMSHEYSPILMKRVFVLYCSNVLILYLWIEFCQYKSTEIYDIPSSQKYILLPRETSSSFFASCLQNHEYSQLRKSTSLNMNMHQLCTFSLSSPAKLATTRKRKKILMKKPMYRFSRKKSKNRKTKKTAIIFNQLHPKIFWREIILQNSFFLYTWRNIFSNTYENSSQNIRRGSSVKPFSRSWSGFSQRFIARFGSDSQKLTFPSNCTVRRKYISWSLVSGRRYESCCSGLYGNFGNHYERNCSPRCSGIQWLSNETHECFRYSRSCRKIHKQARNSSYGERKNRDLCCWNRKSIFYYWYCRSPESIGTRMRSHDKSNQSGRSLHRRPSKRPECQTARICHLRRSHKNRYSCDGSDCYRSCQRRKAHTKSGQSREKMSIFACYRWAKRRNHDWNTKKIIKLLTKSEFCIQCAGLYFLWNRQSREKHSLFIKIILC